LAISFNDTKAGETEYQVITYVFPVRVAPPEGYTYFRESKMVTEVDREMSHFAAENGN
jgi:hypothetical protein